MNDAPSTNPGSPLGEEQIDREMRAIFAIAEPGEVVGHVRRELDDAETRRLRDVVELGLPSDKTARSEIIASLRKNRTAMEKLAADLLSAP